MENWDVQETMKNMLRQQEDYVESLLRLQEIFYLFKNESLDEVSDDELIAYMHEKYDRECYGSLDYLEDTILPEFAREVREGTRQYIGLPTSAAHCGWHFSEDINGVGKRK